MHKLYISKRYVKYIALLLSMLVFFSAAAIPTFSFIVTQTTSILNTFISGLKPEGNLIIRKQVEHPYGDSYILPEGLQFTFRVDLGADYAEKTVETTQGSIRTDENGALSVTLRPDSIVTVPDIPAGTEVTVTEIQIPPGFQVSNGIVSQTVRIAAQEDAVVKFVNSYTPAAVVPVNLSVTGIKNLEGRDWQDGDAYTLQMDCRFVGDEDSPWTKLGTQTVTYDCTNPEFNRFDFTELVQGMTFDSPGIYGFRVFEVTGNIGGITYDDIISYFDVLVGDADMDGMLEIQSVTGFSGAAVVRDEGLDQFRVSITFNNRYAPAGTAEVLIPIVKKVEDHSGQNLAPSGFVFELYDSQGQLVKTSETTSAAGETAIKLVFDATDAEQTYTYVLKEVGSGQTVDGMSYDSTAYTVEICVVDNLDGTVSAVANITEASFLNIYDPQDAQVQLSGTKFLSGRDMKAGEFTFMLYQTNADYVVSQGAAPVCTAPNNADGSFVFQLPSFAQVGAYHYVAIEDATAALGGITYDENRYFVTVTVTDEHGILSAQYTVTDLYGAAVSIAFHNTYSALETYALFEGLKTLKNAQLQEGMFQFSLYVADEHYTPHGDPVQTVSNDAAGIFVFDKLSYSSAGTYHYLIREDSVEPFKDIIYDHTIYGVTITVNDDGVGQLHTVVHIVEVGGAAVEQIEFENVYQPASSGPSEPGPSTPNDSVIPPTGDRSSVHIWAIIAGVSMILLLTVLLLRFYWDKHKH